MHVVIFAGGTIENSFLVQKALQKANYIIAADGGANSALDLGVTPDVVVGDFDSIKPDVRKALQKGKTEFVHFEREKDETDTELALDYALKHGATKITILGGNAGDRFDHVMANIFLALTCSVPLYFISGSQTSWIEKGPMSRSIIGKKGDLLSLIPLSGDAEGITLEGLQYPLKNEPLLFGRPRGVSNVFLGKTAKITFTKGNLLVIHTNL